MQINVSARYALVCVFIGAATAEKNKRAIYE
jgi:hypothetical protein